MCREFAYGLDSVRTRQRKHEAPQLRNQHRPAPGRNALNDQQSRSSRVRLRALPE